MARLCGRWSWGSAALVVAATVQALGLGDAQLLSHLNEPLEVRIPLRLAPGERLDQIQVMLASERAFTMLNIPQTALAYQLRFEVVDGPSPYILIRAPTVVQDPIVQFPIQVTSGEGSSFIRGYTLFLKSRGLTESTAAPLGGAATRAPQPARFAMERPQEAEQQKPSGSEGAALPLQPENPSTPRRQSQQQITRQEAGRKETEPERQESWPDASLPPPMRATSLSPPHQEKHAPPAAAPQVTAREGMGGPRGEPPQTSKPPQISEHPQTSQQEVVEDFPERYGPVRPGETLFQVARAIQPHYDDHVSVARLAAALYQKNPRAFRGAPGLLMKGSTLRLPDQHEVAALQPAQASAILRGQGAAAQDLAAEKQTGAADGQATAQASPAVATDGQATAQASPTGAADDRASAQASPTAQRGTELALNHQESGAKQSATQGRSMAPVNLTPSGHTEHVTENQPLPEAGADTETEQQTPATAGSAPSTDDAPQVQTEASTQMGQPEVLLAQQPGSSMGSPASDAPSATAGGSAAREPPQHAAGAGAAGVPSAASEPAAPAVVPEQQPQEVEAPVMPPPAQHQEGLRGQRSQIPWYVKLAVGIVGIACVLVGLIVFLSRRQRAGGQRVSQGAGGVLVGQASRDEKKPQPGLDPADPDQGSAQAMQQAAELMACGLYQDAQTILEKALAADSDNQRLRLKYLEATAALGQFDKVSEQVRLMAGLDLEPEVRAAVERLMQALPRSDSSMSLSKNQEHEQQAAVGNHQPKETEPVVPVEPAAAPPEEVWLASELAQADQGNTTPEQEGAAPGAMGQEALADDADFERWLMEKPDAQWPGEPSDHSGMQSVTSPDLATDESHAAGKGHVDWGFSGIQESAPWNEEPEQKPARAAWAAPEQLQWEQGAESGAAAEPIPPAEPISQEHDHGIEQFDWPAPFGQNQAANHVALMEELRQAPSIVEPARTSMKDPDVPWGQEEHLDEPAPQSERLDEYSPPEDVPQRPSVLAKPWEQHPPVSTPSMPSYEWINPSAAFMDQPDAREKSSGHQAMQGQALDDGQSNEAAGDGQQLAHDDFAFSHDARATADDLSGNMPEVTWDSAPSQDLKGQDQERQHEEAQAHWPQSNPNQDMLEQEQTVQEAMEWPTSQDQQPQTPGQQTPQEELHQGTASGSRLEQAWEERHETASSLDTQRSGWERDVGPVFAHAEQEPRGGLLPEGAPLSHTAEESHPARDVFIHEASPWADESTQETSPHTVDDELPSQWTAAIPGGEPSADGWLESTAEPAPGSVQPVEEPSRSSGVVEQTTQTIGEVSETQMRPRDRGDEGASSRLFVQIIRLAKHREYS